MAVVAFEGPAGSGKTTCLITELEALVGREPLHDHQRIVALTFMHGARRRLDGRLKVLTGLAGRYEAMTLDSFAWRLVQRWQRLALHLGYAIPREEQYQETCALAGALLERDHVRQWIVSSFPIVLVDEAQDLSAERSAIVAALARSANVLLAFDEFQCLNLELRPIAIEGWLRDHCQPTILAGCHRTNQNELITAARAVRNGEALPREGRGFRIIVTPGRPNALAATWLAGTIRYRNGGGKVAILTPSRQGGFANGAVARVCAGPVGNRGHGPFTIEWEGGDDVDAAAMWYQLELDDQFTLDEALAAMTRHCSVPEVGAVRGWLIRQRSTRGLAAIDAEQLRRQLRRAASLRRRYCQRREAPFAAMTIQQAKNREFEHVVVLWPWLKATSSGVGYSTTRSLVPSAAARSLSRARI